MVSHVTKGLSLVRGRRLRVTREDSCGRVVYGDDSNVVSKGFISVSFTANTTETDEINVTNANGEPCVYEASQQLLSGYSIEIAFCRVDPELASIVTGQPVVIGPDGTTIIGFDIDTKINIADVNFGFELWMGVKSTDGEACEPSGNAKLGYLLLPFLSGGILTDFTVENNAITFTLTGARTKDGNSWGVGPYQDIMLGAGGLPGPMTSPVSTTTALRLIEVDLDAPPAADGARPVLNPSATALTSISAAENEDDPMTADLTTTPAATSPIYWDFGDGTWDYVAAPGATEHEFASPGTYTVRAQQNGVWRSTTVTVPYA